MSCNCPSYTPMDLTVNCFATSVALPDLVADFTGQMLGRIEFAGYSIPFYVPVADGEPIVIPNKFFNETALHILKLYNPDGTLFNNTCYQIALTIVGIPTVLPRMGTPTPFTATPGDGEVVVAWGAVTTPVPATSYVVRRNGSVIYTGSLLTFTDTTAINGVTYTYTVIARAADYTDSYAASASATPEGEGSMGIGSMSIGSTFIIA